MSKVTIVLSIVLALAFAVACGDKNKTETTEEKPAATEEAKPETAKADVPTPPPGMGAPGAPGAPGNMPPMPPMGDLMAMPEGDTHCEKAYNSFTKVLDFMKKMAAAQKDGKAPPEGPSKADFIKACELLPEGLQQCHIPPYAMQNQAECQKARAEVDPATMAKFNAIVAPKGAAPAPAAKAAPAPEAKTATP